MYTEEVQLKYTHAITNLIVYDTGMTDYEFIDDIYRQSSLRNKVVCKMDISMGLTRYFEESTVKQYREALMLISKGLVTDPSKFSQVMFELIELDSKFKESIRDIYYSCPEDKGLGYQIMEAMANVLRCIEADYRTFFRGKPEVVICSSNGYMYFSTVDEDREIQLPDKFDMEVLSHAKNWGGKVQYI